MPEREPLAAQQRPRDPPASVSETRPAAFGVVGVGASAGGLEACRRFLAAVPASPGMAFILVQHLDPTHESMMVELLSSATEMPVVQAQDGMRLRADHFYIIPPGTKEAYQKCIDLGADNALGKACKESMDGLAAMGGGEDTSVGKRKKKS